MGYKCVKQYDSTDCAAACLSTIIKFYGKNVSLTYIRNCLNSNNNGSNIWEICQVAEKLNLESFAVKREPNFCVSNIKFPCIAHVLNKNGQYHFIVLYEVKKDMIMLGDPSCGLRKINKDDFLENKEEKCDYIWSGILIFFKPNKNFEHMKVEIKERYNILGLFKPYIKIIVKTLFLSIVNIFPHIICSYYFKIVLDFLIPRQLYFELAKVSIIFVILEIINIIINKYCIRLTLNISSEIATKILQEYYSHVIKLPFSFHTSTKSGEIIARLEDVSNIQSCILTSILILPPHIFMIVIVGIILFLISPTSFIITLTICIVYTGVSLAYKRIYECHNNNKLTSFTKMTTNLIETIEGIETIKNNSLEDISSKRQFILIKELQNQILKLGNAENNHTAIKELINRVGQLFTICICSVEVMQGKITLGELVTLNILISYILNPFKNIVDLQPKLQAAIVSMQRLEVIFLHIKEDYDGDTLDKVDSIKLNKVKFGYCEDVEILTDVTLEKEKQENISLIGYSGSGKTTVARLLLKHYEAEGGNILINNRSIKEISTFDIRKKIVYVSQEEYIFSTTVKNNITLWNDLYELDEIIKISQLTGVHEFVHKMNNQYNTILDEHGKNLSKGQKQKLALARALLKKPQILILDEATSNIDSYHEKKILEGIKNIGDITLILITHRLSNVVNSDRIYIFNKGQILACGKHNYLVKNNYEYKKMLENGT